MSRLETRVPPPVWAGVIGALMFGVNRLGAAWTAGSWARPAGFVIALIGVGVAAAGIAAFARARTTVDPHDPSKATALVATGIYRLTRNPMYVGLAAAVAGWGLVLRDPVAAAAGAGVFVAVITRLQIVPEERFLRERFGDAYVRFSQSTRRWL